MLNNQPTIYLPPNLENEKRGGKKLKKKNLVMYTTNSQREREILTPELQSTVNIYLH